MSVYHVFTAYCPKDPDTVRRNTVAQMTWKDQLWTECPVRDEDLSRMWEEEGRRFPYIRDVFDFACQGKDDTAIMVHTNADIHVRSDACAVIAMALQFTEAAYCFRRDFGRLDTPLRDEQYVQGNGYAGHDLTGFRVRWWRAHRQEMPDMVLGLEAWDPCIRILIDATNRGTDNCLHDLIGHERHGSYWESGENRYRLRGQQYCLQQAKKFMMARGFHPRQFGVI